MLQYLPNALTFSRLLLALPLGVLILREQYELALGVGFLAGVTDGLDGFFARRLNAYSRFGAAMDPVADKLLITVSFLGFATVGLIPWYVAATVIIRDLVIVSGAICYHWLIGPFEFAATRLSKLNMLVQIGFCVLVLAAQVVSGVPPAVIAAATVIVLVIAVTSGVDYVVTWSIRAMRNRGKGEHPE
jgi:cardiolipin synthase